MSDIAYDRGHDESALLGHLGIGSPGFRGHADATRAAQGRAQRGFAYTEFIGSQLLVHIEQEVAG